MDMTGCQLWGDVAIAKFYDYYADEKGGWELFCTSVYTFTEWGDVESFEFYNQHGERTCIRKHIYDEQGRTTETHIEWEDMSDTTYTTYTYDGAAITTYQGGTIVTERYNDYGDVVYCHTYGRETNTAETEEYIYHYDGENKVFCEYIINGEPVRRTIYGYAKDQVFTYEMSGMRICKKRGYRLQTHGGREQYSPPQGVPGLQKALYHL